MVQLQNKMGKHVPRMCTCVVSVDMLLNVWNTNPTYKIETKITKSKQKLTKSKQKLQNRNKSENLQLSIQAKKERRICFCISIYE